jgi:hypothetical protein
MGARLVSKAFATWAHLGGPGFQLLAFMALTCHDSSPRPRVELSRESMAKALGYESFTRTAESAVTRAVRKLLEAGALELAQAEARGQRRHFWIKFDRPASVQRSSDVTTVGEAQRSSDVCPTVVTSDDREADDTVFCTQEEDQEKFRAHTRAHTRTRGSAHLSTVRGGSTMHTRKPPAMPGQKPITGMPAAIAQATWSPAAQAVADAQHAVAVLTDTITQEWLDRCRHQPPSRVRSQVRAVIRELVEDGIQPDDIRRGCAQWMAKGLAPSVLPSVVNAVLNARPTRHDRHALTEVGGQMLSQRSVDSLELIERMRALDEAEAGQQRAIGGVA